MSSYNDVNNGDGSQYFHDKETGLLWLKFVTSKNATTRESCSGDCATFQIKADVSSQGNTDGSCLETAYKKPKGCIPEMGCTPPPQGKRVYQSVGNDIGIDYACTEVECTQSDASIRTSWLHL